MFSECLHAVDMLAKRPNCVCPTKSYGIYLRVYLFQPAETELYVIYVRTRWWRDKNKTSGHDFCIQGSYNLIVYLKTIGIGIITRPFINMSLL